MVTDLENMYPQKAVRLTGFNIVGDTPKAIHICMDGRHYWIPESQILGDEFGVIDIPYWLAREKEMI